MVAGKEFAYERKVLPNRINQLNVNPSSLRAGEKLPVLVEFPKLALLRPTHDLSGPLPGVLDIGTGLLATD
jgi:hypothetical protein